MDTNQNDGGAAYPHIARVISHNPVTGETTFEKITSEGMSLRDWFAGMALQGELASTSGVGSTEAMAIAAYHTDRDPVDHLAITCYEIAGAMLKARSK